MKQSININGKIFSSVKLASENFAYSRDHITRLAKAKKISATQQGRRWFVDGNSILNYSEDQKNEAHVRQEMLRRERQNELAVRSRLSLSNDQNALLENKSNQVAILSACSLLALCVFVSSKLLVTVPELVASVVVAENNRTGIEQSADFDLQPVFTDSEKVTIDSGREIFRPEVTPNWVQISP